MAAVELGLVPSRSTVVRPKATWSTFLQAAGQLAAPTSPKAAPSLTATTSPKAAPGQECRLVQELLTVNNKADSPQAGPTPPRVIAPSKEGLALSQTEPLQVLIGALQAPLRMGRPPAQAPSITRQASTDALHAQ